jgi:hypothetical protein
MAWKKSMNGLGALHDAFAKQPSTIGRMGAPAVKLAPGTMMPRSPLANAVEPKGSAGMDLRSSTNLPKSPLASMTGSGGMQSPAQHMAVEKAARASAAKRKKGLL